MHYNEITELIYARLEYMLDIAMKNYLYKDFSSIAIFTGTVASTWKPVCFKNI